MLLEDDIKYRNHLTCTLLCGTFSMFWMFNEMQGTVSNHEVLVNFVVIFETTDFNALNQRESQWYMQYCKNETELCFCRTCCFELLKLA
jgi:hypothetical protein